MLALYNIISSSGVEKIPLRKTKENKDPTFKKKGPMEPAGTEYQGVPGTRGYRVPGGTGCYGVPGTRGYRVPGGTGYQGVPGTGKNHINVKNTQQDFSYLGGKALRAPLYSGDRNGLSPPRAPAELEKQASRGRRWLVMRRAGEGEGTIEVYSI